MGALIGGIITEAATLITAYYVLDQQQQAFNQQQITEQKNIAQALYIDICAVEELFNHSLNTTNPNDYFTVNLSDYYSDSGLYYVFNKDILKFNAETSNDLYDFYFLRIKSCLKRWKESNSNRQNLYWECMC